PWSSTMPRRPLSVLALIGASGLAAPARAQTAYPEVEPNNDRVLALARPPFVLGPGDSITGTTTYLTDRDFFLVRTTPLPLGIYRHRLVLTTNGTAGHNGAILGSPQSGGIIQPPGTVEYSTQGSSTTTSPPRMVQWYGFGKAEQFVYSV